MRVAACLLAALLSSTPLAAAQRSPAAQRSQAAQPPAALPEVTASQRAELQQAVMRGRMLAALLQASIISTRDMLVRLPAAQRDAIVGWIGVPEGNGITVTYFGREGDNYVAIYRGPVMGTRVSSPEIFAPGSRPPLTGLAARMAAARMAAEASANRPCTGDAFNTLVLPPQSISGPVLAYQLSPRANATTYPTGGHYRVTVGQDGHVTNSVALAPSCGNLTLPLVTPGQRPRPPVLTARDTTLPNEIHVFLALWTGRPLVIDTGTAGRVWGIDEHGSVGELHSAG